jgi:hypothetical protein
MTLQQTVTGPAVTTENMYNIKIQGAPDPNVYAEHAHSWFRKYTLSVTAPAGWHFIGTPYVNCVKDDRGAFDFNNFHAAFDRFFVTQRTPNEIVATCWVGSRSIIINLACVAEQDFPPAAEEK